jgi:retron-type reverse transcriptase
MSTQLEQIATKAKADRTLRFTSLAHLLTPAFLMETWRQMNRHGASGVDGETTTEFERELETRVQDICERLKAGTYRAPPVRRVEIPKGPGKVGTRPLGIPTVRADCTCAPLAFGMGRNISSVPPVARSAI